MPSEHCVLQDVAYVEQAPPPAQVKVCSSCQCQLSPESINLVHTEVAIVCITCRERICARRSLEFPERQKEDDVLQVEDFGLPVVDCDVPLSFRAPTPPPAAPSFSHSSVSPSSPIPIPHHHQHVSPPATPSASPDSSHSIPPPPSISLADPHADITRLRVRSHGQDCLFPGAQFSGTQKSGRSSYEVSVTIVDVDFTSSFLCGYLRIRGLTDDWPELTTYFDAQIIGSRYGFLTDDWGASEQDDMTHWARFPAFQKVRQEIRGPRHTIRDRDRDCVFMRWKERFLVPDHRVRDINGASFAGFYYVCVEFDPHNGLNVTNPRTDDELPLMTHERQSSKTDTDLIQPSPPHSNPSDPHCRWNSGNLEGESTQTATMSGFYFHQHSEPYQQLSLHHVPQESLGSFEFR